MWSSQPITWKRYNRKIQAKYNSNKANNAKLPWFSDFLRHLARKRDYNALAPTRGNAKTHIKSADGKNIILKSYQNSIKSWRTTATLNMTENCNTSVIVESRCHKLRPSITITFYVMHSSSRGFIFSIYEWNFISSKVRLQLVQNYLRNTR